MPLFLCKLANVAKVQDIINILEEIAPEELAQSWDNVGLLIGSPENRVSSILLALDPTIDLIKQACEVEADLLITHHPAVFHPLKSLRTDQPTGHFIHSALQASLNVIGCHTNLDSACGGVNDVLAGLLGLQETKPLLADSDHHYQDCSTPGLGRVGRLSEPLSAAGFINLLNTTVAPSWLLEAGPRPDTIKRVAVCGGSCSDFAETAMIAGADVLVTAEVKHATACWARETGFWIIDGGHFATENPAMEALGQLLTERLDRTGLKVQVETVDQEPPLKLIRASQ